MKRRSFLTVTGSLAALSGCTGSTLQSASEKPEVDRLEIVVSDFTEPPMIVGEDGLDKRNPEAEKSTDTLEIGFSNPQIHFAYSNVFHEGVSDKMEYMIRAEFRAKVQDLSGTTLEEESTRTGLRKGTYDNFGPDESIESFTQDWLRFPWVESGPGDYKLNFVVEDLKTGQVSEPEVIEFQLVDIVPEEFNQLWRHYREGYQVFATAHRDYAKARSYYTEGEWEKSENPFENAARLFDDALSKIGLKLVDRNNEKLTDEMRQVGRRNKEVVETYEMAAISFSRTVHRKLNGESGEAQEYETEAHRHHQQATEMEDPMEPEAFKRHIWGDS